jgi:hypothetical protein
MTDFVFFRLSIAWVLTSHLRIVSGIPGSLHRVTIILDSRYSSVRRKKARSLQQNKSHGVIVRSSHRARLFEYTIDDVGDSLLYADRRFGADLKSCSFNSENY